MRKIALPLNLDNTIDGHFGHCKYYNIYSVSDEGEIIEKEKIQGPEGCGCKSNIAQVLAEKGVSMMLAGGIGNGAVNVLKQVGIDVVRGCSGDADQLIAEYLRGELKDSGINCSHHEHENGEHSCSEHHHGA